MTEYYVAIDCNGTCIGIFKYFKTALKLLKRKYPELKFEEKMNDTSYYKGVNEEDCWIQRAEYFKDLK